jgi:uncharacterized protein (TIGR02145 family)
MKLTLSLLIGAFILLLISCKKDSDGPDQISISNSVYPTVKIGNQRWTAVSYNGPGGKNYNDSTGNDPAYGKLYTLAEVDAIKLPKGWRLPTENDYINLIRPQNDDADIFLSRAGWWAGRGTNLTGFNAYPSGFYAYQLYRLRGSIAVFITSSLGDGNFTSSTDRISFVFTAIADSSTGYGTNYVKEPTDRGSVRFVKDE